MLIFKIREDRVMLIYLCQGKLNKYEKVMYKIIVKTEEEKGHHAAKLQSRKQCYDSDLS